MSSLAPGLKAELHRTVTEKDSAAQIGSGGLAVLATPVMIAWLECAAADAVAPHLPAGSQTVGTHVDVKHLAATPLGLKVTAHAELTKVEGRTLTFRVWAEDEREVIGEGIHQRAVIDVARFMKKVEGKAARS